MKPKSPGNGLSVRANRCLSSAGIPAERKAVLRALKTGALYPYFRPTLYGKKTHEEVCRWAGLDQSFVSPTVPQSTRPAAVSNGLSARANHCLFRAGIPAEKGAVRLALQSGALRPGKRPVNYGKQTQAELCRWAGVDQPASPPGSEPQQNAGSGEIQGEYWRWCPQCGHELNNEKCKLRCPRCHYFMSCSDFD